MAPLRVLSPLAFWRSGSAAALDSIASAVVSRSPRYACFCEGNLIATAAQDGGVHAILSDATWLFPDGVAAALLARRWGRPVVERVPGPSFLLAACSYGVELGWRHYFYGGGQEVLSRFTGMLTARIPGIQIAGRQSPPFRALTADEDAEVVREIRAARPDLLWVGLGAPKQERWIRAHMGDLGVPVTLGVGAAFDFHGGGQPWAPGLVRRVGLEWAWRMLTGGPRVLARNLQCVRASARILFSARPLRPSTPTGPRSPLNRVSVEGGQARERTPGV